MFLERDSTYHNKNFSELVWKFSMLLETVMVKNKRAASSSSEIMATVVTESSMSCRIIAFEDLHLFLFCERFLPVSWSNLCTKMLTLRHLYFMSVRCKETSTDHFNITWKHFTGLVNFVPFILFNLTQFAQRLLWWVAGGHLKRKHCDNS